VSVWEPFIKSKDFTKSKAVFFFERLDDLSDCGALIITRELTQAEISEVIKQIKSGLVLDPWRQISDTRQKAFKPGVVYVPLGR
jgi:hypothetical protein